MGRTQEEQLMGCVARELGAARGGSPLLESLTIGYSYGGYLTWQMFGVLSPKFPALVEL